MAKIMVTFLMLAWYVLPVQRCLAYSLHQPSSAISMQVQDCANMSHLGQRADVPTPKSGCVCAPTVAATTPSAINLSGILPDHYSPQVPVADVDRVTTLFEFLFRTGRTPGFSTISDAAVFLPFDRQVVFLK